MNSTNATKAQETPVCCCVDVGTVMDNTDCKVSYKQLFIDNANAEAALNSLIESARAVESEPCQIESAMHHDATGVLLAVDFIFSCQAEALIFQLRLR